MIIDELRQANIRAMKERDASARAIFSIVLNKCLLTKISLRLKEKEVLSDEQVVLILQKTVKELEEEVENYKRVQNAEGVKDIIRQKEILEQYLPELLSKDEILDIISSLSDKSMPSVMKYFKVNYAGKVDMKLVNECTKADTK